MYSQGIDACLCACMCFQSDQFDSIIVRAADCGPACVIGSCRCWLVSLHCSTHKWLFSKFLRPNYLSEVMLVMIIMSCNTFLAHKLTLYFSEVGLIGGLIISWPDHMHSKAKAVCLLSILLSQIKLIRLLDAVVRHRLFLHSSPNLHRWQNLLSALKK